MSTGKQKFMTIFMGTVAMGRGCLARCFGLNAIVV